MLAANVVGSWEEQEFVAYFPEHADKIAEMVAKRDSVINDIETLHETLVEKVDAGVERKLIALEFKNNPHFSVVFGNIMKGKDFVSGNHVFANYSDKLKIKFLS